MATGSWQRESAVTGRGRRSAEVDLEIPGASTRPAWREDARRVALEVRQCLCRPCYAADALCPAAVVLIVTPHVVDFCRLRYVQTGMKAALYSA